MKYNVKHYINVLVPNSGQQRQQISIPVCQRRSRLLELVLDIPHDGFDTLQKLIPVSPVCTPIQASSYRCSRTITWSIHKAQIPLNDLLIHTAPRLAPQHLTLIDFIPPMRIRSRRSMHLCDPLRRIRQFATASPPERRQLSRTRQRQRCRQNRINMHNILTSLHDTFD